MQNAKRFWTYLFVAILILPIAIGVAHYQISKNYDYIVETDCDPNESVCYIYDCVAAGECELGEIEYYALFSIKAFDFPKCMGDSCQEECENGLLECRPISCGESPDDLCSVLFSS